MPVAVEGGADDAQSNGVDDEAEDSKRVQLVLSTRGATCRRGGHRCTTEVCTVWHETTSEGIGGEFAGEEGGGWNGICVAAEARPAGFVEGDEVQDRDDAFEADVVPELDRPGGSFDDEAGEGACRHRAE